MKYLIVATISSKPRDFQALTALLLEKCEKLEVKQLANGDGSPAKPPRVVRWSRSLTCRMNQSKTAPKTPVEAQVFTYLSKKYGAKTFNKGAASAEARKSLKNGSVGPAITRLMNSGHIVPVTEEGAK